MSEMPPVPASAPAADASGMLVNAAAHAHSAIPSLTHRGRDNGMFSLGFTVDHSDKTSGVLTGKRKDPQTGAKVAGALLFGVIGLLATGDREEAVTFMVTALEPKVTQLRMKVLIDGKQVTDREFMTKIWQQIEREAMLESRPSDRAPSSAPATAPALEKAQASAHGS